MVAFFERDGTACERFPEVKRDPVSRHRIATAFFVSEKQSIS